MVTVTPAALVVMTVRQGIVVLLVPDMRISPVTVKTFPAVSVVVMSVVGIGEVAAFVVACVATGRSIVTPAERQNCWANTRVAKRDDLSEARGWIRECVLQVAYPAGRMRYRQC